MINSLFKRFFQVAGALLFLILCQCGIKGRPLPPENSPIATQHGLTNNSSTSQATNSETALAQPAQESKKTKKKK